jgi:tRNA (guanine-N7-)-methyltransferase
MIVMDIDRLGGAFFVYLFFMIEANKNNWDNPYRLQIINNAKNFLEEQKSGEFLEEGINHFKDLCSSYDHQLALEIGSGSGLNLIQQAKSSPNLLHIGVEKRYKRAFRTIEKGSDCGALNLFMIRSDIKNALKLFKSQSFNKIFIHFPDPWDKRRWHKNRVMLDPMLSNILALIKKGGIFSFRTDHLDYFVKAEQLLKTKQEIKTLWRTEDLYNSEYKPERPCSEFESLFVAQKKPIGALLCQRN